MARQVTVVTPENIALTLEEAGIATRFGAFLIDIVLQLALTLACCIITGILVAIFEKTLVGNILGALIIAEIFLVWFGYFLFFEAVWNGQTPGKRVFGLRVMRDGGYPIDLFTSSTRNLIRIADFLPMGYLLGAVVVLVHPQYKRLGDIVAGTVVIKERMVDPRAAFRTGPSNPTAIGGLPPTVNSPFETLTSGELLLLRRFVLRRWEMTPDDAERLAYRLIVPLIPRLNLTFVAGAAPRYADLASTLVANADRREAELDAASRR